MKPAVLPRLKPVVPPLLASRFMLGATDSLSWS